MGNCRDLEQPATGLTWDLDGDGVIDEAGLDTTDLVTTYDDPGQYAVTARVWRYEFSGTPAKVTITVD